MIQESNDSAYTGHRFVGCVLTFYTVGFAYINDGKNTDRVISLDDQSNGVKISFNILVILYERWGSVATFSCRFPSWPLMGTVFGDQSKPH